MSMNLHFLLRTKFLSISHTLSVQDLALNNLKSVYIILSILLLLIRNPQNNLLSSFQPKFVLQKVVLVPPPSNRPRSRKVFIDSALYFIVFIFQDAVDPLDVYNKYDIHIFR